MLGHSENVGGGESLSRKAEFWGEMSVFHWMSAHCSVAPDPVPVMGLHTAHPVHPGQSCQSQSEGTNEVSPKSLCMLDSCSCSC